MLLQPLFWYAFASAILPFTSTAPIENFLEDEEEDVQKSTNQFVDDIIEMFRDSWGEKLDPLYLPNQYCSFSRNFISMKIRGKFFVLQNCSIYSTYVNVIGEASLVNGTLFGLSRLQRTENASMAKDKRTGVLFADVTAGVENLLLTGKVRLSILGMNFASDLTVRLALIETNIKACLHDLSPNPIIEDIIVTRLEGVDISLPELGHASPLIDITVKGLIPLFRSSLKDIVRKHLLKFANVAINKSSQVRLNRRR